MSVRKFPTAKEHALIDGELRLALSVQEALESSERPPPQYASLRNHLSNLRDQANAAKSDDLPSLLEQMHTIRSQMERLGDPTRPDARAPYFGHMQVQMGARRRDVLLGHRTFLDRTKGVNIIDWTAAPLATVFYDAGEDEPFELELADRTITGVLHHKCLVRFERAELVEIQTPSAKFQRNENDQWERFAPCLAPRLVGSDPTAKAETRSSVLTPVLESSLDEAQRAILELAPTRPLLLLGGAGSGKTTVALHRMSHVLRRYPKQFRADQALIIVPERGLARLTRAWARALSMSSVEIRTFDEWIVTQAWRVFPHDPPQRLCSDPPASVVRFKRHPSLWEVLPDAMNRIGEEVAAELDKKLGSGKRIRTLLANGSPDPPLLSRLSAIEQTLLSEEASSERNAIREAFRSRTRWLSMARNLRSRIVGDRALLAKAVEKSNGELTSAMAEEVIAHTSRQLDPTTEQQFAHVDVERLVTLDGRGLDEGTPQEDAGTMDVEDLALLVEFARLIRGDLRTKTGDVSRVTQLVVDEAQDLAPIELGVLGHMLGDTAAVTMAGDLAQQLDPSACFVAWESALQFLGIRQADAVQLETIYRCTRPVTEFAYRVLGPLAPAKLPEAVRDGVEVARSHHPTDAHAFLYLHQALGELIDHEPDATIAVVTHDGQHAEWLGGALARFLPVRVIRNGDFSFRPGIDVVDVGQVKGLEFDCVVLPDVSSNRYPDDAVQSRRLHVAATRAIHQLWVMSVGAEPAAIRG